MKSSRYAEEQIIGILKQHQAGLGAKEHLHAVTGFMRASAKWDQFYRMMDRAFPRKGKTIEMAFDD